MKFKTFSNELKIVGTIVLDTISLNLMSNYVLGNFDMFISFYMRSGDNDKCRKVKWVQEEVKQGEEQEGLLQQNQLSSQNIFGNTKIVFGGTECVTDLNKQNEMIIFWVTFDHF